MTTDYEMLCQQIASLAETDASFVPLLANASALLWEAMADINWAGFYLVRGDKLVLGPFQGKAACIHIAKGRGVCGTAWQQNAVQRIPNVHEFPGHIACDGASNAEIVIPLRKDGAVFGVLDIDSPVFHRFSARDQEGLERFARILETVIDLEEE